MKKIAKKTSPAKSAPKKDSQNLDLKKELIDEFLEKGKRNNVITYEEVIEFSDKNHLSEADTNDLMRQIEKENIDLVMQEELEGEQGAQQELEKEVEAPRIQLKDHFESSISTEEFEEDEEQEEEEEPKEKATREPGAAAHITDAVKCYLRDIGKIPLLNKKTET